MKLLFIVLRFLLKRLYRVEVRGLDRVNDLGDKVIVVANHTSFLDGMLLYLFLPFPVSFAINTEQHQRWYIRAVQRSVNFVALDPLNPLSIRTMIQGLQKGGCVVIFPEGRITVTGALMKIYNGPGLVAIKSGAQVVPVAIEGAQYTPFSRLRGKLRLRLFPKIVLTILPPRIINAPKNSSSRDQREYAGKVLADLMAETVFKAGQSHQTLFQRLLEASRIHGSNRVVLEDIRREPLDYKSMFTRVLILGDALRKRTLRREAVGVLLPNSTSTVVSFWALLVHGRVPAMLNYSAGNRLVKSACETAKVKLVITSRSFIEKAQLEELVETLSESCHLLYLEDLATEISMVTKLSAFICARFDRLMRARIRFETDPEAAAVILFTSGSEGDPKGVVLSHRNLLANVQQVATRISFNASDVVLNVLPLFHSFGLMGACLVPLFSGVRSFYYPSPLHYRVIPEVAYDINATVLFGTGTFLAGYGKAAHPYDFFSMRYVVAGAERLQPQVRQLWQQKFGIRIFEGYGVTECSPVVAVNTPLEYQEGSVGRLMPGMDHRIEPVEGLSEGGRLFVRGPNVMKGYLRHDQPGVLDEAPEWYDTGDIAVVDGHGFVTIKGRISRFAKLAGEMVSLVMIESAAAELWPNALHVALTQSDESKGERIVLLTTETGIQRSELAAFLKIRQMSELYLPKELISVSEIPLLATGKINVLAAKALFESMSEN